MQMISLALLKLISSLSILSLAWLAGAWVIYRHTHLIKTRSISYAESFANGVFLGTALFHLLPDAQHAVHAVWGDLHYRFVYLVAAVSFLALFLLEYYSDALKKLKLFYRSHLFILYVLVVLFSIHSVSAGIALGISSSLGNTWILLIAILAHKGCEAYALATHIKQQISQRTHQLALLTTFSTMTPLGIALATFARMHLNSRHGMLAEAYFNAIAGGTFLYIATLHSTVGQWRQGLRAIPLLPLLAGVGVMALVAIWA